jgi:hypothetical protein
MTSRLLGVWTFDLAFWQKQKAPDENVRGQICQIRSLHQQSCSAYFD